MSIVNDLLIARQNIGHMNCKKHKPWLESSSFAASIGGEVRGFLLHRCHSYHLSAIRVDWRRRHEEL